MPDSEDGDLLEPDLLNPHYPAYYNSQGRDAPPSDDQNPTPIYFLAVRPAVRFRFPFRLRGWPGARGRGEEDEARAQRLGGLTPEAAAGRVRGWIAAGLAFRGAGAKTAAGYGYFEVEGLVDPSPELAPAASRGPVADGWERGGGAAGGERASTSPRGPAWQERVRQIRATNADAEVPRLLADLAGEERRLAAAQVVRALGKKTLLGPRYKGRPWVWDLLSAAGEG